VDLGLGTGSGLKFKVMVRLVGLWFMIRVRVITFRIMSSQAKSIVMPVVCVCLSVPVRIPTLYCTDPDVTLGTGIGCPLVVQPWVDLQSVHRFRNIGA